MQTAYRCKNCRYVHMGKVSSCDCDNKPFAYTLVAIIDVPENDSDVPPLKSLKYSTAPRFCNYVRGQSGNGIYEQRGTRADGSPIVQTVGHMYGSFDSTDVSPRFAEDNMRANCVMAAAGPLMLEALYMCNAYFRLKGEVQGESPRNTMRLNIIREAIKKATDISVFKEPQDVPSN